MPTPDQTPLEAACDRVLIDTLPLGLRRAIWNLLKRGGGPKHFLTRVKGMLDYPRLSQGGHLMLLAVEAYVEAVVAGREPEPHDEGPQPTS